MPTIPLRTGPPEIRHGHLNVHGYTAPITVSVEGNELLIELRRGGLLLEPLEDVSAKLMWLPDKVREFQKEGKTRI